MRAARLLAWLAGTVVCATLLVGAIRGHKLSAAQAGYEYGGVLIALTIGVLVWRRRPDSRTGMLLVAFAVAASLSDLWIVFPRSAVAVTTGLASIELLVPLFAHAVLSYPTGRLQSRVDRVMVIVAYAFAFAYALPLLLFYSPGAPHYPDVYVCPYCADPLTHVAWHDVTGVRHAFDDALLGLAIVFVALLARKLLLASSRERTVVIPLTVAAAFVAAEFIVQFAIFNGPVDSWTNKTWFWITTTTTLAVPLALAAGILWGRTSRGAVADLVLELERTPRVDVRDALARAVGDPSLELALWLPEHATYVSSSGRPVELPQPGAERAVTLIGHGGAPLAAMIHDPALLERRGLLDAAGAAASLAIENERLQAELKAQLLEIRASRARIVDAGDRERRRLERDLHDGAQQRLLGLGLALQLARSKLGADANGLGELLAEADGELRAALTELRALARGIHPTVLTEQGLGPALQSLADRSSVPVRVEALPDGRVGDAVEAAAYFLVSEGLANVAKHANASTVRLRVVHVGGLLVVDLADDGIGGAERRRGSGLNGLADRVHALEGTVEVDSEPGAGTAIHAEIPCA
jgi:signal transduction histidine kinase